ncbi:MAG: dephospho-CoA kinase [Lachnospiraceae bacterium]|nr:dephospho-CoA kinase [Lachnospiraceae bacterium]
MKIIGITGGVGCGKSELLSFIEANYPCVILRADDVAKELEEPGMPCYEEVVRILGGDEALLQEDGRISYPEMAKRIFLDESLREKINAVLHPAVRIYVEEEIASAKEEEVPYFFLEAALLIEAKYLDLLDELWVVSCPEEIRRERLKASRGYSDEKITGIMERQLSDEEFLRHADFVIDNSGDLIASTAQIAEKLSEE